MSAAGALRRAAARVPLRLRLTAAFAVAMALVLLGLSGFLADQLHRNLTRAIDQGLVVRADQIVSTTASGQIGSMSEPIEHGDGIAQLLDTTGKVLAYSPGLTEPLLSEAAIAKLGKRPTTWEIPHSQVGDDETRILAYRTTRAGKPVVVAVGASVEPREIAETKLVQLLLVGGPLALLIASGLGYWVAAAALAPVDRMRRQAQAITADDEDRLTVPPARDELHALADTLNGMLDRLQLTLDRERAFTMDASHELRTPLAVLKAELEVALRPQRTREELVEALQSASDETDRLSRLAEDLLVLARAEHLGLPLRRTDVDLDALLERVTGRFGQTAATHGAVVDYVPTGGATIDADEARVEQALSNLIANALQHGATEIRVNAQRDASAMRLSVEDDGDGFPPDFLPRAFERFTQADASRHASGTGLGLAIVRTVAAAHGGAAIAQNGRSGGALVSFTIADSQEGAA